MRQSLLESSGGVLPVMASLPVCRWEERLKQTEQELRAAAERAVTDAAAKDRENQELREQLQRVKVRTTRK